jgi:DNA-binding NarL/FixJ family response regulator
MNKISVLLVDDHALVRQGLRALLEAGGDIAVVGEAENGQEAVALAEKTLPDVVLMDLAMPRLNGVNATRQITRRFPSARVLVLSAYGNDDYVTQAMEAGATGYMLKQTAADDLLKAIREVDAGHPFFSPSIAKYLRQQKREATMAGYRARRLTSREVEVLQLVAQGCASKQIATELSISNKTVEKHREHVMYKLDIHSIAGLTRYAIAKGWVEPGPARLEMLP